jgi:Skp family chaperone for outer membrane proteins
MKKIILTTVVGLSLATGAFANGTQKVKEFELEHAKKLHQQAKVLQEVANDYYKDLKAYGFNYNKA